MKSVQFIGSVLMLETSSRLVQTLADALISKGFNLSQTQSIDETLEVLNSAPIDLVMLNREREGLEVNGFMASLKSRYGVDCLAYSFVAGEVELDLEPGYSQIYLANSPSLADEIEAKAWLSVRSRQRLEASTTLEFMGWKLNKEARRLLSPAGKTLILSTAEFALLRVFLAFPNRLLNRSQILHYMTDFHDFTTERALATLVSRLRQKLAYAGATMDRKDDLIQAVYGGGYIFRMRGTVMPNPLSEEPPALAVDARYGQFRQKLYGT